MAPPTATATETATHTGVIKMNTDVEDEELKFEVDSLSRGPNQLQGMGLMVFVSSDGS